MLVPQRRTAHVEESLVADLTQGLVAHPRRTFLGAALGLVARSRGDGYLVPMGGSNVLGSMGYVDAARELRGQIEAGALPEPDLVVVTLGSGGTAAGLAAGFAACGLRCRVLGVVVATPAWVVELYARWLSRRCFARAGGVDARALEGRMSFSRRYLGAGYGEPTKQGARALERAASVGLTLDPTYTAKAFAAALDVVAAGSYRNVLYWHTLSSAPMAPLVSDRELPPRLRALLKSGG